MSKEKKNLGNMGEQFAMDYLISKKYKILDKNICLWGGQIDIIAQSENQIHFIEVKTRTKSNEIAYIKLISQDQINTLIRAAKRYLFFNDIEDMNWQIDLLFIVIEKKNIKKLEMFEDITF
jgi:putative endonuclease